MVDQDSVDAESDADPVFHRLDMDIADIAAGSLLKEGVYDSDYRFLVGLSHFGRFVLEDSHYFAKIGFRTDNLSNFAKNFFSRIEAVAVHRIDKCDRYFSICTANRHELMNRIPIEWNFSQQVNVQAGAVKLIIRKPQMIGKHLEQAPFFN